MKDFFDLLYNSSTSLIGYTFRDERLKDEVISKIKYINITEYINSGASIKQLLREERLNFILNDVEISKKFLLIDINEIFNKSNILNRAHKLKDIINNIKEEIYLNFPYYNLLVLTPLNTSVLNVNGYNFSGGLTLMYISDVVISLSGNKIRIIKNRFGGDKNEIISPNGLREYKYEDNK